MTQRPIIIGAGGHAASLVAMAPEPQKPTAYVDPERNMNLEWLGDDDAFLADESRRDLPLIICFVATRSCSMLRRKAIIDRYAGRSFATVIAPDAIVEPDSVVGAGTMIFHRAFINTGVFLGDHVIVNTGAIVEHNVTVGENVFIGPGAVICGDVNIGRDVYIGAGACLRNGINVADGVTVGIGAVVVSDILTPGTYVGNPARKLNQNENSDNSRSRR